ncbi:MAG TPA: flavodoxin domain-containing protein [Sedimentisphaerales bacterium]|nr:flavodoxin domain-containing protein [Sedimentisphaerales bacterium]
MAKAIVIYHSRSGNTQKMAEIIAEAMNEAGLPTECKPVAEVKADDLLAYDAIVVGSPTYYGHMAAPIKQLFDETVSFHGKLDGKVAAAFTSSANIGGGNETTIMGIIEAMLIAGCIVQGDPNGDHYGPVSIGKPDERVRRQCMRRGRRIAELTHRLANKQS